MIKLVIMYEISVWFMEVRKQWTFVPGVRPLSGSSIL